MNKVPPNFPDAEVAVLGSILQLEGGAAALLEVVGSGLRATDFYSEKHSIIYRAIMSIHDQGIPVDLVSLTRELQDTEKLDQVGGVSYLDELIDSTPTAANAGYYASQVLNASRLRAIIRVSGKVFNEAYAPQAEPADLLAELHSLSDQERLTEIGGKIPSVKDQWYDILEQMCKYRERGFIGLHTGFERFDEITSGIRGLCVIGGMPGQGKSTFALQLTTEIARLNRIPCLYFALEMSGFDLGVKIASRLSKLDYKTLMIGSLVEGYRGQGLTDEDMEKLMAASRQFMEYAPMVKLIDRSVCRRIDLGTLRLQIQQAKQEHGADHCFAVIDHLQIFPCSESFSQTKDRLDFLIAEFKAISEQYDTTILLISEVNRDSYGRKWIGAYMGTAGIEFGVDIGMLLFEDLGEDRRIPQGERDLELVIQKGRLIEQADIKMRIYPEYSNFQELS